MAIKRISNWIRHRPTLDEDSGGLVRSRFGGRLGELLLTDDVIDEQQLRLALERQRETGEFLGEIITSNGFASAPTVGAYLSDQMGFSYSDLSGIELDLAVARKIDEDFARKRRALPIREDENEVTVAMVDPLDVETIDALRSRLNRPINASLAFSFELEQAINAAFTVQTKAASIIEELGGLETRDEIGDDELLSQAGEGPIVRLVQNLLEAAIRQGASDIHIEPQESNVRIRFRVDGLLYDQMRVPLANLPAVVSRIKIISHLNIAERRRPQDGRFVVKNQVGNAYDVRVSTVNTVFGEKVVMRLLEKQSSITRVDRLGFLPAQQALFSDFIKRPYGVILVTGPTGSGKSTTMFAGLSQINDPNINISTVEDPVEYHLPGANQINVNHKIGVTFATGLRTLVRQDPDVIMVGEIRDAETAEIAIQAALTGHLVLSTLHTNDAPGALIRLQNMGVEPYLVSSAVIGIIGQRLLRTICPACREWYTPDHAWVEEFNLGVSEGGRPPQLARGRGCARCNGRGMKGRTAVCEIMPMTDGIRELVLARANTGQLAERARQEGMATMRQIGVKKMLEGLTTPEEVVRVLYADEED